MNAQKAEYQKALENANGLCTRCGNPPDWRGLCLAHVPNRGMGGRDVLYLANPNAEYHVEVCCYRCHNVELHHLREG